VRFATGVLREQCSLVTMQASQRACMRMPLQATNSTQVLFV
jgi:hypothetical protein